MDEHFLETTTETLPVLEEEPKFPTKKYSNNTNAYTKGLGMVGPGVPKFDPKNTTDPKMNEARLLFSHWDKVFRDEVEAFTKKYPLLAEQHKKDNEKKRLDKARRLAESEAAKAIIEKKTNLSSFNDLQPHAVDTMRLRSAFIDLAATMEEATAKISQKRARLDEAYELYGKPQPEEEVVAP